VGYAKRGDQSLSEKDRALLSVDGRLARPHILWFDEAYEESLHRSESAMARASRAGLLITVGSSGATNLPLHAVAAAARNGAVLLDINPNANPFSEFAQGYERGAWLAGSSSEWLPRVVSAIR
jgi:NAD-dependent deacetylase